MIEGQDKETIRRLRKSGMTRDAAERWLADWRLRDAPEVRSTVAHDPTTERVRLGRFVVVRKKRAA